MAVKYMSDIIKQKTGGKDTIKVYTMSQLGSEKDTIEQTKIGALDFVRINVAPMNNICPETMVPTMPFLFKSKEHMRKVLDGPIGDEILKACEKQGFVGLAFYDSGSRSLYTVKKPVKSLADVKGTEDPRPAVGPLGGAAAGDGRQRDADALRRGVHGAEDRCRRRRREQLSVVRHGAALRGRAKYYAITEHSMAPEMLLMSKKVYDTLTPEEQKIIRDAAKAVGARTCASCGTKRSWSRGRWSRRAVRRSSRSTRNRSRTR